ncbi:MAG: type II secretion system protein GspL [Porticoccaceae bacterium]
MTAYVHFSDIDQGRCSASPDQVVSVWVPSEQIACHVLEVPPVPRKKWQAMIPWLLEDRLLERPEITEFICADKQSDNLVAVIAVSKAALADWQQRLKQLGIRYSALMPDFFSLPWQKGTVTIALVGERCLVRSGQWQGAAGALDWMLPMLEQKVAADDLDIVLYSDKAREELPQWLQGATIRQQTEGLFASACSPCLAIASGERNRSRPKWPLAARVAAVLALLGTVLLASGYWLESQKMAEQARYFDDQLRQGYRQYFGGAYDFPMADFQRVVSAQLDRSADTDAAIKNLLRLDQLLSRCGDCRLEKLSGDGAVVEALVSGESAGKVLASAAAGEVQASGEHWLLRLVAENQGSAH